MNNQHREKEDKMEIGTLSGIRVLDLSCLLPEFRCSMMLGNLVAEVEKKNII